jgi:biotin carboxyl carrier protein
MSRTRPGEVRRSTPILVQVGQVIQVNDVLMVLDAMKTETAIMAPLAGEVVRINANVRDSFQGGRVLVEFP